MTYVKECDIWCSGDNNDVKSCHVTKLTLLIRLPLSILPYLLYISFYSPSCAIHPHNHALSRSSSFSVNQTEALRQGQTVTVRWITRVPWWKSTFSVSFWSRDRPLSDSIHEFHVPPNNPNAHRISRSVISDLGDNIKFNKLTFDRKKSEAVEQCL